MPGLAENRPSVIKGDQILVRVKDGTGRLEKEEYQGFVHIVGLSDVHLRFSPRYMSCNNNNYTDMITELHISLPLQFVEPHHNEEPEDWQNIFTITRFHCIKVLFHIFYITRAKNIVC